MEQAIHTIRTAENANKTDTPEYAEAIDTFNAANGYQLEPKAKKILKGLAFRKATSTAPPGKCPAAGSCARTWPSSLS
ncbi:MAG: hypothetical protein ACLSUW_05085 [Akkermansia sp.]